MTVGCRRRLLPEAEPEVSEALEQSFRDEGIVVRTGVTYEQIRQTAHGVALSCRFDHAPEVIQAEQVLVTAGRRPNTNGLGLAESGVALSANGGIRVNNHLRTTNPAIYAAGDVTGRHMFVYMAAYGANIATENALNGDSRSYDATGMPAVVFTDPQVASVGLTEADALAAGMAVRTSVLPLEHVPRALAARDTRGLIKLIAEAEETQKLVGAHIIAPEGADSIQTAALAIKHGLTYVDLAESIFPYLTTVEGLKLAAQTFDQDVAKLSCCAG